MTSDFYSRRSDSPRSSLTVEDIRPEKRRDALSRPDLGDVETPGYEFCPLPPRIDPGTLIGDFRVIDAVGVGGSATVFRAFQESRERHVALKVLSPHLLGVPAAVQRFEREAELCLLYTSPSPRDPE